MAGEFLRDLEDDRAKAFLAALEAKAADLPPGGMIHPREGTGNFGLGDLARLLSPGADYDYEAEAGDLWRNSAVAACLRVAKANFPQPRPTVVRKAGKGKGKAIEAHPAARLLLKPNGSYDWYQLGAAIALAALVDGNVYLLKIRSQAGKVAELWWVPPWMMEPKGSTVPGGPFISHYEYRVNGQVYRVDPADVIHYRHGGMDPRNTRKAMSELKAAAARSVCSLNEVDGYTASILRNMGVPTVIIAPSQGFMDAGQAQRTKALWRENLTGERRGDPFVPTGPVTVTKLSMSPEEMSLKEIPSRLEDQICALTGINSMVAGLTAGQGHKTYANQAEARRGLYDEMLIPFQAAFCLCLDHQLIGDAGMGTADVHTFEFDYSHVSGMSEDQALVWTRVGKAYKEDQVIKRSEARDALGLEYGPDDEVYYDEVKPAPPPMAPGLAPGDPADEDEDSTGEPPEAPENEPQEPEDDDSDPKGKMADPFGRARPPCKAATPTGARTATPTGSLRARLYAGRSSGSSA